MTRIGLTMTTALGAVFMLAACHQNGAASNASADQNAALPALPQAVPMQGGPATAASAAPSATALPAARPIGIATVSQPSDAYAYADRATGFSDAIGDAPPDYAFDYDGVSPWAWQTGDGDTEFAEPVDGGYRYYYYQPGESYPYLVRDPSYSYAYDGPNLVAVYGVGGALLAGAAYREHLDAASRYRARAAGLYQASREREHRGVVAANWAAHRPAIAAARSNWSSARDREPQWQAYHQAHEATEQEHWNAERGRRKAAAQRFQGWQRDGYRGAAPNARPDAGREDQSGPPQRDDSPPDREHVPRDQTRPGFQADRGDRDAGRQDRGRPGVDRSDDGRRSPQTKHSVPADTDRGPVSRPKADSRDRPSGAGLRSERTVPTSSDRPIPRVEPSRPAAGERHDVPSPSSAPRAEAPRPSAPHEAEPPAVPRADAHRPPAPRAESPRPAAPHAGQSRDRHPG